MFRLSVSEWLLYGGLAVMAITMVAAIVCILVFKMTGKKIKSILEQEYGTR